MTTEDVFTQEDQDETREYSLKQALEYIGEKTQNKDIKPSLLYGAVENKLIAYYKKGQKLYFTRRALNDFLAYLTGKQKKTTTELMTTQQSQPQTLLALDSEPQVTCYRCGRILLAPEDYEVIRFLIEIPQTGEKTIVWHPVCADKRCDPASLAAKEIQEQEKRKEHALEANAQLIGTLREFQTFFNERLEALIQRYDVSTISLDNDE